ncbi:MAG: DUF3179 domain-containing (seleno)protein [Rubripirellula sp.]
MNLYLKMKLIRFVLLIGCLLSTTRVVAGERGEIIPVQSLPFPVKPITEPPCSYCVTQHQKNLIRGEDRVIAWLRAAHNGGAFPIRHFLAGPRVVNDTYGLFFYDPDGGYVSAFEKNYGFEFSGWRNGVMVVQSEDGTTWSALTGMGIDGPRAGKRLKRIPSLVTSWDYWMMLHPESTTYDLFDGKKYPTHPLPTEISDESIRSRLTKDQRLVDHHPILGIEIGKKRHAFPLPEKEDRACFLDEIDNRSIAVFWYRASNTAVAFDRKVQGRLLTFYADEISPATAPFKDKETGTRWSMAGRGIDGPLRGVELSWVPSIQCRWFSWSNEYPETTLHSVPQEKP